MHVQSVGTWRPTAAVTCMFVSSIVCNINVGDYRGTAVLTVLLIISPLSVISCPKP